jgi:formate hydrogenlyase transcriptional activator
MGTDKDFTRASEADKLRRRAEEQLTAQAQKMRRPRTEYEAQRLLHELQVYQLELEMQLEQLHQAKEEIEISRNKYAELYDLAPVGYFTFDAQGLIRELNLAGAQMLGVERQLLIQRPFASYVAEGGKLIFSRHLEVVVERQGMMSCEIELIRGDGTAICAHLQSLAVDSGDGQNAYILTSIIDVTQHKRLEAALQKLRVHLESMVQERTGNLVRANEQLMQTVTELKSAKESLKNALAEIIQLKSRLQAENVYLQKEVAEQYNYDEIIGHSNAMSYVFFRIEQVAPQDATVLLLGETGTGKGVIARAIHRRSSRKDRPMITVNCSALPSNLIESELFGREKGAFTGANASQIGRFELADGGTIFLDEIGEMPLELQCKLLRVIQDGQFERLGCPRTIKVDVRIIAASNRKLEDEIRAGRFREDLFYRLNVFPITIPPLRQRKEDIPLLVNHFVAKFNKKIGKNIETVSKQTLEALHEYDWPGNVRELESIIERAVIISPGTVLKVLDRFENLTRMEKLVSGDVKALAELERNHILEVLQTTGWRIEGEKGAALLLGLHPSTLRARMRKYGIRRQ